ncbi:MAG TPA: DNA polymerase/3'-5' exonuclease PolX [Steroidobacteraceae bacterium]|nr:DNA polymerase/3'-5' exonuclease PolX [Steroidobacteraceae bacterium]
MARAVGRAQRVSAGGSPAKPRSSDDSSRAGGDWPAVTLHNEDVAAVFDEMADLLAIEGENAFRIRAYRRAAQVIRGLSRELSSMRGTEEFAGLPGVGSDLAGKIAELLRTGRCQALEQQRRHTPPGVRELLALPALGPVRVRTLFIEGKVRSIDDLGRALAAKRLGALKGFGPGILAQLSAALADRVSHPGRRLPLAIASQYARPLVKFLQSLPGVDRAEIAGSYRRGRDTVGDLDILICCRRAIDLAKAFGGYSDLDHLSASGATKASGTLRNGLQVDFRVLRPESFGSALHYFTGSRDHNIHLRRRAQERGYKLSEYGLFKGKRRIAGKTEEELFAALGLPWIPPELREDRGEIEAAERDELPKLIELADLVGDLHVHTSASDGGNSLEEMVAAARARGLRYIAITDHSKHVGVTHGLDAGRLAQQIDAIDALNSTAADFTILKGAEVDILEDGRLALPDSVLRRLDLVIGAVHTQFNLPAAKQTARVLRALERPCVSVLAHPFGRLLGERAAYALDFERVLEAARARPCYLEINAQPLRLDLDDIHAKSARDRGVLLSIASDAHSTDQLGVIENGVRQARRAWVRKGDVLNTRPLGELRPMLRSTMR